MTISSIGFNSSAMGQMSVPWCRSGISAMSQGAVQKAADGGRPNSNQMFSKVDQDNSGGLDQAEFQTLADKISETTGDSVDIQAVFDTYDKDGDGELSQDETDAVMGANRPQEPPPSMGGMEAMQGGPPPGDFEIFSDADENEDGSLDETEVQALTDIISQATGEALAVDELFATYDEDEDGDGTLSAEEAQTALAANRPQGPPPSEERFSENQPIDSDTSAAIAQYMRMVAIVGREQNDGLPAVLGRGAVAVGGDLLFSSVNTIA